MAQQLPSYDAMQQAWGQPQQGLTGLLSSPVTQGLLGAGLGAMASRGNTMQAIGRGGLLGLSAYGQAQDQQQNKLLQMAQAKMQQDAMNQLQPGADGAVNATPGLLMRAGFNDPSKWEAIRNIGRDKLKQTQEVTNADGSKSLYGVNEYGGVSNTGLTNAPEIKTQDLGGTIAGINPYTGQSPWSAVKTATYADRVAQQNADTSLGQLGVAQGNLGVSQGRLALDAGKSDASWTPNYEQGVMVNSKTGEIRGLDGVQNAKLRDANDALSLLGQADSLIDKATGSGIGSGVDWIGNQFGMSTESSQAAAQLKALEGALVAKMPKMSGPQSDKDVAMYRQMAGDIGNPSVPAPQKRAAIEMVRQIQQRYANQAGGPQQTQQSGVLSPQGSQGGTVPAELQQKLQSMLESGRMSPQQVQMFLTSKGYK